MCVYVTGSGGCCLQYVGMCMVAEFVWGCDWGVFGWEVFWLGARVWVGEYGVLLQLGTCMSKCGEGVYGKDRHVPMHTHTHLHISTQSTPRHLQHHTQTHTSSI